MAVLGHHSGVVALIQQEAPQVIGIHCVAHNLELAFADTLKSNSTMKEIKELLNGCWKHYQYSPKALKELRELAEAMEVRVGKPTKADGTRWVPHLLRALKILLDKNFSVLVSHFEHTAEARDSSAIMQGRAKNVIIIIIIIIYNLYRGKAPVTGSDFQGGPLRVKIKIH